MDGKGKLAVKSLCGWIALPNSESPLVLPNDRNPAGQRDATGAGRDFDLIGLCDTTTNNSILLPRSFEKLLHRNAVMNAGGILSHELVARSTVYK